VLENLRKSRGRINNPGPVEEQNVAHLLLNNVLLICKNEKYVTTVICFQIFPPIPFMLPKITTLFFFFFELSIFFQLFGKVSEKITEEGGYYFFF
jgi:hypothetical protein